MSQTPRVHHPWRLLRERLPDWHVIEGPLPHGLVGATDARHQIIHLAPEMSQRQRRAVLDHEILHAQAGDDGCQHPKREAALNRQSARQLIPLDRLIDAATWSHSLDELAEECWVDADTMQCRLDNLTDDERAQVRRAVAERDFHEEGLDDCER